MHVRPHDLAPPDRYKLLIGAVVPRPIAVVSTCDAAGRLNLAPFSFFTAIGADPMTLLFCPANRPDGTAKDSLANARPASAGGTGAFVVNVAVETIIRRVVAAAEPLPPGASEFDLTGLTPAPSLVVVPPRVAESPVAFECRTREIVELNPGAPGGANVVIGDVVAVFVRDDLVNERFHVDAARLAAVGRMGGTQYCTTRERFALPFGRPALDVPDPFGA
jgi:flavin reductase (DIM6/NTAB) family NADH-FMN oxidoreductase RutF